jgi:hypothetical protein
VIFKRELATGIPARLPAAEESEDQLEAAASDTSEPPSGMAALAQGAQRVVRILWRLARTFLDRQDLFDERPRGGPLRPHAGQAARRRRRQRVARRTRSHPQGSQTNPTTDRLTSNRGTNSQPNP